MTQKLGQLYVQENIYLNAMSHWDLILTKALRTNGEPSSAGSSTPRGVDFPGVRSR
jgi:hypothetical protein